MGDVSTRAGWVRLGASGLLGGVLVLATSVVLPAGFTAGVGLGTGVGVAQESGDAPSPRVHFDAAPPAALTAPVVVASGNCQGDTTGAVSVQVTNPNGAAVRYQVDLYAENTDKPVEGLFPWRQPVDAGQTRFVSYPDLPPGSYDAVVFDGQNEVLAPARVCDDDDSPGFMKALTSCWLGEGSGLAQISAHGPLPEHTYQITLDGDNVGDPFPGSGPAVTHRVDGLANGTHTLRLLGEGVDETDEFKLSCGPPIERRAVAPQLFTGGFCLGDADPPRESETFVVVRNLGNFPATYTVVLRPESGAAPETTTVTVLGNDEVFLIADVTEAGDHPIEVIDVEGDVVTTGVAVVDHCADFLREPDAHLQTSVRCVDGQSWVTFRFYGADIPESELDFSVDGTDQYDETVSNNREGQYTFSRYRGTFADGTYTARLRAPGFEHSQPFTVDCDATSSPSPTSTTTATSSPTTAPTSTTTAPPPQGGSRPDGLASTGATIGGIVALGLVALALGTALVLIGRRHRTTE